MSLNKKSPCYALRIDGHHHRDSFLDLFKNKKPVFILYCYEFGSDSENEHMHFLLLFGESVSESPVRLFARTHFGVEGNAGYAVGARDFCDETIAYVMKDNDYHMEGIRPLDMKSDSYYHEINLIKKKAIESIKKRREKAGTMYDQVIKEFNQRFPLNPTLRGLCEVLLDWYREHKYTHPGDNVFAMHLRRLWIEVTPKYKSNFEYVDYIERKYFS